jgi:EAL domain-containing protein (putative c-di-GMP-specific phosphodiesterase class I)
MYLNIDSSLAVTAPGHGHLPEFSHTSFLNALRHAIDNDELCLEYQPRQTAANAKTNILEALVRWNKAGSGMLYPSVFIDAAIEHGLIFELDQWVFRQCCEDLIWLREHVDDEIKIAVNISAIECESLHHTQKLVSICDAYGLCLSNFEFEITESTHIRDARKVKVFCETVTAMGAEVSLDDFGTGQSPLSSLCSFPVNTIKIDRSFVQKPGSDCRNEILVRHMIALAHEMSISIVAEGIENEKQYRLLKTLGCHQLQGHFICRPLPRHLIVPYLAIN